MGQIIPILGMHRSGTSALAEALVAAGAWFGEPAAAAAATPARPLGLVERKDFLALTNGLLRDTGHSWHDVHGFRQAWDEELAGPFRRRFEREVLADLLKHSVSLLKDPRLCLLLPLFQRVLPETVGIMIARHPLEVAASLYARNQLPLPVGMALWEFYNRHAIRSLRGIPSVLVQHRQLMQRPEECLGQTLKALADLGVHGLSAEAAISAATIKKAAQHQRASLITENKLSPSQRHLWRTLRQSQSLG